jgi:hypothetical protein
MTTGDKILRPDWFQPVPYGSLYVHARWCARYFGCVLDGHSRVVFVPVEVLIEDAAVEAVRCLGDAVDAEDGVQSLKEECVYGLEMVKKTGFEMALRDAR